MPPDSLCKNSETYGQIFSHSTPCMKQEFPTIFQTCNNIQITNLELKDSQRKAAYIFYLSTVSSECHDLVMIPFKASRLQGDLTCALTFHLLKCFVKFPDRKNICNLWNSRTTALRLLSTQIYRWSLPFLSL